MTEPASSTTPITNPDPAPAAGSTTSTPPVGDDVAALKQRLAALEQTNAVLKSETDRARQEAAKYRTRNDEETAKKLAEQGDYKTLFEKSAAELATVKAKAEAFDATEARRRARLDAEFATLPAHLAKVGKALSSDDAEDFLVAHRSAIAVVAPVATTPATPRPPASPAAAAAASPPPPVDVRSLPIEALRDALRDPAKAAAVKAAFGVEPPPRQRHPITGALL